MTKVHQRVKGIEKKTPIRTITVVRDSHASGLVKRMKLVKG